MNAQALAIAIAQIQAVLGLTVRHSAGGVGGGTTWQMQAGTRWLAVLPATAKTFDDIYADCLAQLQAQQAATQGTSGGGTGPGGTTGGPAGGGSGGSGGVRSRIRISRHPGLSLGVPGVRLRLGARTGLMLSPEAAAGPVGTAVVYGATIVGVIGVISAALFKASRDAATYAREVASLSDRTGLGLGASNRALQTARGFGLADSDVSRENGLVQSRLSRLYGGSGTGDQQDIAAFRSWYRGMEARGLAGTLQAQRIAERANRSGYIGVANLSDRDYAGAVGRQNSLSKAFGMNPQQLETVGRSWTLLMASVSSGWNGLVTKAGAIFISKVIGPIDRGIQWLADHSGIVGKAIEKGMDRAFEAGWSFAEFLYVRLPRVFTRATRALGEFMMNLATGFEAFRSGPIGMLLFGGARATPFTPTGPAAPGAGGEGPSSDGAVIEVRGHAGDRARRHHAESSAAFWVPAGLVAAATAGGGFLSHSAAMIGGLGIASNPLALGLAGGVGIYEAARKFGGLGGPGQPSTFQMAQYGLYKGTGLNTMGGANGPSPLAGLVGGLGHAAMSALGLGTRPPAGGLGPAAAGSGDMVYDWGRKLVDYADATDKKMGSEKDALAEFRKMRKELEGIHSDTGQLVDQRNHGNDAFTAITRARVIADVASDAASSFSR